MTSNPASPPPGWYPNPNNPTQAMYWNGQAWDLNSPITNPTPVRPLPTYPPLVRTIPARPSPTPAGRDEAHAQRTSAGLLAAATAVSAVLVSYFIANQFSQGSDRIWIGAFAIPVLIGLQAWRRYRLSRRLGAEPLHIGAYLLLTGCGIAITFGAVHLMTVYNNDGFRVGACANNRAELVSCSDTTALYSVYKLTDTANDCANTYTELTNGTIACVYPRTP